jgi:hypothetical protein
VLWNAGNLLQNKEQQAGPTNDDDDSETDSPYTNIKTKVNRETDNPYPNVTPKVSEHRGHVRSIHTGGAPQRPVRTARAA